MASPTVSILLPVRNEATDIKACLASLLKQDYDGPVQIVIAEGMSEDTTRQRIEEWTGRLDLEIVDNPHRVQSKGLNLAAAAAAGDVLIRADGHTIYPPDYVSNNVASLLTTEAAAVGGLMNPVGDSTISRAVAAAMKTRLAIGPGRFHHADEAGPADTVYLGAFRRADFERLGGYRTFPSGVAEDADLYFRWRKAGETIHLDPTITSAYRPRRSLGGVWRQAYRWGKGKSEMWFANSELPYLRPLIPLGLVLALLTGGILAAFGVWWPLLAVVVAWTTVVLAAAVIARHPLVAVIAATMQLAYGVGVIAGLLRGRKRSLPQD